MSSIIKLYTLPSVARRANISVPTAIKRMKEILPFATVEFGTAALPVFTEDTIPLFRHKPGTRGVHIS
jgi:hypothetical protein